MADRQHRPWRDNLEAVTMAIVMAVLFKYFVVEAYKIPTGSMQPTLFGWEDEEGGGVYDRILVNKASYHWRDPERFEVIVFKFPLDRSKNFIKRLWGLPGDHIRISHGDVWLRRSKEEPWRVLRRPDPVQRGAWLELDQEGRWEFQSHPERWRQEGADLIASDEGQASFPAVGAVMDNYTDGYPPKLAALLVEQRHNLPGGNNYVGDLRLQTSVVAAAGCEQVRLVLHEGTRVYTAKLPGPAAAADARPELTVTDGSHRARAQVLLAEQPFRLRAGRPQTISLENLDDLVRFDFGQEPLLAEVAPGRDQRSTIQLETRGGGAAFRSVELFRDVYYTSSHSISSEFEVPQGNYLVLGDNTLDSADSREWQLSGFRVAERGDGDDQEPREFRGGRRGRENPVTVLNEQGDPVTFFQDEYGERRVFPMGNASNLTPAKAPFVPRENITGRALLVFWPLVPRLDVYRLRWIR